MCVQAPSECCSVLPSGELGPCLSRAKRSECFVVFSFCVCVYWCWPFLPLFEAYGQGLCGHHRCRCRAPQPRGASQACRCWRCRRWRPVTHPIPQAPWAGGGCRWGRFRHPRRWCQRLAPAQVKSGGCHGVTGWDLQVQNQRPGWAIGCAYAGSCKMPSPACRML